MPKIDPNNLVVGMNYIKYYPKIGVSSSARTYRGKDPKNPGMIEFNAGFGARTSAPPGNANYYNPGDPNIPPNRPPSSSSASIPPNKPPSSSSASVSTGSASSSSSASTNSFIPGAWIKKSTIELINQIPYVGHQRMGLDGTDPVTGESIKDGDELITIYNLDGTFHIFLRSSLESFWNEYDGDELINPKNGLPIGHRTSGKLANGVILEHSFAHIESDNSNNNSNNKANNHNHSKPFKNSIHKKVISPGPIAKKIEEAYKGGFKKRHRYSRRTHRKHRKSRRRLSH